MFDIKCETDIHIDFETDSDKNVIFVSKQIYIITANCKKLSNGFRTYHDVILKVYGFSIDEVLVNFRNELNKYKYCPVPTEHNVKQLFDSMNLPRIFRLEMNNSIYTFWNENDNYFYNNNSYTYYTLITKEEYLHFSKLFAKNNLEKTITKWTEYFEQLINLLCSAANEKIKKL